ncbi:SMI1/KNR4 family protein [Melghirimyces algeriensis]|uniref:SMI1-KNR4 cell-wall n=1 Tax=Melghirimyces algeriensis TaxID=910412 RepID=A0A521DMQ0_9BACL|nr:SMI1/KNR4 family protein [Melghirimyces algeriensis]SMO72987.1 SMI1-KNR4 cell-wall [Melghirimyces algeriensis]
MEWRKNETPANSSIIRDIEQKLGICFPADYLQVVKDSHGKQPTPNVIDFGGLQEKVFGSLLSFEEGCPVNLWFTYKSVKDVLPKKVIPFGCDPFGNLYCFDYRKSEDPTIVYWYHEADRITKVCDTFTELEGMFYEPEGIEEEVEKVLRLMEENEKNNFDSK